jgi:hypothetical protein
MPRVTLDSGGIGCQVCGASSTQYYITLIVDHYETCLDKEEVWRVNMIHIIVPIVFLDQQDSLYRTLTC